ncbi:MAG TPA: hypothetical protein VNJ04_03275 [Gemmatimonadaceae bacterium]|nr:hypothetical protein [Gemmatimonadaceae bacterium]
MKFSVSPYPSAALRGLIGVTSRRAVSVALAAALVSCSENITAPPASLSPTVPVSPDVVLMERTTSIAAHDGVAAVHRTSRRTLTPQVRARGAQLSNPAAATENARLDIAHLASPTVSLPARYETAMCKALPDWTQTIRDAGTGGDVEMTGAGDAPASKLRVVQDGKTVLTVERTWVRTPVRWQLGRQVITSADGRYRDVVTYQHVTQTRQSVNNALPVVPCATSLSSAKVTAPTIASRSYYAPRGNPFLTPPTGASSYLTDVCTDTYLESSCYDKQIGVYKADAALVAAATLMTYACLVPSPIVVASCVGASTAYALAVANLAFAQMLYNNCRAAAERSCGCKTQSGTLVNPVTSASPSISGAPSTSISLGARAANPFPSTIVAPGTLPASSFNDCADGGGGGGYDGGGGGGGEGSGGLSCKLEDWEISYDGGVTWEYWGTFWVCYADA